MAVVRPVFAESGRLCAIGRERADADQSPADQRAPREAARGRYSGRAAFFQGARGAGAGAGGATRPCRDGNAALRRDCGRKRHLTLAQKRLQGHMGAQTTPLTLDAQGAGRKPLMTYVVTENCIRCKFMDCVEVCPVDCFYAGENMLVIHPDECIDWGVCEPECPAEAIVPDSDE